MRTFDALDRMIMDDIINESKGRGESLEPEPDNEVEIKREFRTLGREDSFINEMILRQKRKEEWVEETVIDSTPSKEEHIKDVLKGFAISTIFVYLTFQLISVI